MNRNYLSFVPILACLLTPLFAGAQSTVSIFDGATTPAVQTPSAANSVPLSEIEHHSNYNGGLSLTIPLRHIGGRGETGYDMLAVIHTTWDIQKHFNVDGTIGSISPQIHTMPLLKLEPVSVDGYDAVNLGEPCSSGVQNIIEAEVRFQVHWADGSEVNLRDTGHDGAPVQNQYQCQANPPPPVAYDAGRGPFAQSRDGSELLFQFDSAILDPAVATGIHSRTASGVLYTANGLQYRIDNTAVSWMKDRNGNKTNFNRNPNYPVTDYRSLSSVTDSTGNTTSYIYGGTPGECTGCDQIQYTGYNGAVRRITIRYGMLSAVLRSGLSTQSYSQLFPSITYLSQDNTIFDRPGFISSITYPDGSSYQFRYDPYGYVSEVTLPTGGKIDYDYASGIPGANSDGVDGDQNDTYPLILYRRLVKRSAYDVDGSFTGYADYIWEGSGNDYWSKETVKDASGKILTITTTHYSSTPEVERSLDPFSYSSYTWGRATKVEEGDPVKKTTDYTWAQSAHVSWCDGSAICYAGEPENDPRLTNIKTTLNDTQQVSEIILGYDQFNNVNDRKEYDFGNGAHGTLIRHTRTDYVTDTVHDDAPVRLLRLPKQVTVYGNTDADLEALTYYYYDESSIDDAPGIPNTQHDPAAGLGDNLRGNVTTKKSWQKNPDSYVIEKYTYDITGNLTKYIDGRANAGATQSPTIQYKYNDANNTYAHPTTITNALGQPVSNVYDYYTGKLIQTTDLNGVNTVYSYAGDPLDRLKQIRRAAGGGAQLESQTNFDYPSANEVDTYQDKVSTGDEAIKTKTIFDGFGRPKKKVTVEDGSHTIETTTNYDVLGRVGSTFNPTQVTGGSSNDGLGYETTYTYDSLNRVIKVVAQDNSPTTTEYKDNVATITDAMGRQRKLTYDALGRLKEVAEDPNGVNYATTYNYDPLDDLISVDQGSQHRSFTYDGLRRLKSATNPESGKVDYTYDEDGNLKTKKDARNITVTYTYDPLNRIQSKQYSDGVTPTAGWVYDSTSVAYGKGRLSSVSDGYSVTNFLNYNALGQLTQSNQQTLGQTYSFSYGWNLAGSLTSETYPSGRVVTTSYDEANRASGVQGAVGSVTVNYVSNVAYWPHGVPYYYILGNHIERVFTYNKQLQADCWWDAVNNSADSYLFAECPAWGYGNNNGNLQGLTAYEGGPGVLGTLSTFSAKYTYDNVNRLHTAADNSGAWSRTYEHDQFGNMWISAATGIPLGGQMPTSGDFFSGTGNRMAGATGYDPAGNQTQLLNGAQALAYDAENRMIRATDPPSASGGSVQYFYDANGQRVVKEFSDGGATVYVYDAFGKLAAAYNNFAATVPPCATCYFTTDYLGSVRMVTDPNANVVTRHDYLPFGEEILAGQAGRGAQWGATSPVNQKFTGQIRDQETGLDYFGARYLSAAQGRFTSPDDPFADQDPSDPQSWNLYSYVRNNPLSNIDPSGNDCITTSDQSDTRVTVTVASGSCEGNKGVYIPGVVDTSSLSYNGSSLTYSFASDTASGAGTINFVSPQDSDDISPFGAAVIRSVGARTNASYGLMATFAGGSVIAGGALAASPLIGGALTLPDFVPAVANFGSKQAARAALAGMKLTPAQVAAALSAIARATSSSSIQLVQQGQTLVVNIARAGANGYQVVQSVIDQAGNKRVVQKAFDAANTLVHYDPKN